MRMTTTAFVHEPKWWQVAAMSVLAPVLAGSIQTIWVLVHGMPSEYYQALFYPHKGVVDLAVATPVVVGVELLITFFLLWCSMRARLWLR